MKLEQARNTWDGKSDEWLYERLANELSDKVEEIHLLLEEINKVKNLTISDVISRLLSIERFDIDTQDNGEFIEQDERVEQDGRYTRSEDLDKLISDLKCGL